MLTTVWAVDSYDEEVFYVRRRTLFCPLSFQGRATCRAAGGCPNSGTCPLFRPLQLSWKCMHRIRYYLAFKCSNVRHNISIHRPNGGFVVVTFSIPEKQLRKATVLAVHTCMPGPFREMRRLTERRLPTARAAGGPEQLQTKWY